MGLLTPWYNYLTVGHRRCDSVSSQQAACLTRTWGAGCQPQHSGDIA